MNNAFKALLAVAAIVLAWLCYNSITTPIKFSEEKERREKAIIQRLSDIRKAEVEYRNLKGDYTDSFDTLMNFIKNEKSAIILKEGELTDKQLEEGMTEKEAVKLGLIKRDTTYVSMQVALFGENYNVDSFRILWKEINKDRSEVLTEPAYINYKTTLVIFNGLQNYICRRVVFDVVFCLQM